jgi:hypothetical protein
MAGPARAIRSWWVLLAFFSGFALAMLAEDLILDSRENRLEFSSPRLHFLAGKPLERLRNAAQVPFDFQATLFVGSKNRVFRRNFERFVVSYDLWEETFSVSKLQLPRKQASHLSAPATEAWCLQQMSMDITGLSPAEQLWARLEVRAQDESRESGNVFGRGNITETGISLNSLIEIFSRPPPSPQAHWVLEAGPLKLEDLRSRR